MKMSFFIILVLLANIFIQIAIWDIPVIEKLEEITGQSHIEKIALSFFFILLGVILIIIKLRIEKEMEKENE
jgi:hypothetical protein